MRCVVVRGHPGDIPGFPVEIWILGYYGCCVLVAGKHYPQQSLSFLCLSFLFFLVVVHISSRRPGWLTYSRGIAICCPRAELGHSRRTIILQYSRVDPSSHGKFRVRVLGVGIFRSGIGREGTSVILGILRISTVRVFGSSDIFFGFLAPPPLPTSTR